MRWLPILIPITAYAANGDETVSGVGFLILSAATLIYRYKRYTESKRMKDSIQAAIDTKPAIAAAIGGGALTFTATNIISLVGMCVGVAGLVIAWLQYRENKCRRAEMKRANDIARERLEWEKDKP